APRGMRKSMVQLRLNRLRMELRRRSAPRPWTASTFFCAPSNAASPAASARCRAAPDAGGTVERFSDVSLSFSVIACFLQNRSERLARLGEIPGDGPLPDAHHRPGSRVAHL